MTYFILIFSYIISHKFVNSPMRAHRGHIQYDNLLQLFYNIAKKMEKNQQH